ncbi:GFA family protein [Pseudoroseicyclus sp. CXY001]|uniref:GFA family protein n=1 Tax=Pseudoroseicyclus sp. CXY001 TaxID=3242492 RepID=UPI00358DB054
MHGRCTCGDVTYRLTDSFLCVHCCHCRWCQRETGSAFVLNGLIETRHLEVTGAAEAVLTPSASGKGQEIRRCPRCRVALWSHYAGAGPRFAFVRCGTLDAALEIAPDVHIFTETKLPWVTLPPEVPAFAEFYRRSEVWAPAALARRQAELERA